MKKFLEKFTLSLVPVIAGICLTICYLPQLLLTYQTRNVSGQSLSFWLILDVALLGFVVQQIGLLKFKNANNYIGLVVQCLNLLFALIMTYFVIVWR